LCNYIIKKETENNNSFEEKNMYFQFIDK